MDIDGLPVIDQMLIRAVERNAQLRAAARHAVDAIRDGNTDLATCILLDLMEDW